MQPPRPVSPSKRRGAGRTPRAAVAVRRGPVLASVAAASLLLLFALYRFLLSPAASSSSPTPSLAAQLLTSLTSASRTGWTFIHPPKRRQKDRPEIRYNTAVLSTSSSLLVTHGYFYNKDTRDATWLADTWTMPFAPPHTWRALVPPSGGETATPRPAARYGHSAALHPARPHELYLFGGTDGGARFNGGRNFDFG
jgi:hypothetical protein